MASNVDHVKVKHKVVVDGAGVPLMAETLAWHTFCVGGAPNAVAPMTRALYDQCREYFNSTVALFEVSGLAGAAGVPITLRHDDTVNPVQYAKNSFRHVSTWLIFRSLMQLINVCFWFP